MATKEQAAAYRLANKEKVAAARKAAYDADPSRWRWYEVKSRYGLTKSDYETLLDSQGGTCAICKEIPPVFHVDHNHKTGKVRGLLCASCNLALGKLKDSAERAAQAAIYLRKHHE